VISSQFVLVLRWGFDFFVCGTRYRDGDWSNTTGMAAANALGHFGYKISKNAPMLAELN